MTPSVQITIIALGIILLFAVIRAAIQKKIAESHALLWIFPCLIIIIGGLFPQLTYVLSNVFNTSYPPAIIFAFAIIIVYLILFQCFKSLSVLTMKNKELASQTAILAQQIQNLETELETLKLNEKEEVKPETLEQTIKEEAKP